MNLAIHISEAQGIGRPARADTFSHFARRAGSNRRDVDGAPPRGPFQAAADVGVKPAVRSNLRVAENRDIQNRVDSPCPFGAERTSSQQDRAENEPMPSYHSNDQDYPKDSTASVGHDCIPSGRLQSATCHRNAPSKTTLRWI